MAIKIKRKVRKPKIEEPQEPSHIVVGTGPFSVLTINRHDGSVVEHRFRTEEEAEKQLQKNILHDQPLVGVARD
jgi:hypothetical protein